MPIENDGLTTKNKLQVDFSEISLTGSKFYHSQGVPDYNPDELVGRKGLEIYKKMRDDDQIKAVLTMKKFARLMTPWEISPASQDSMDVEIAEFIKVNFETLEGTFEDNLLNILTALDFGFSLSEKIWYRIEKGQFAGKIGLKAIKTREPFYYQFESDNFGNLVKNGIVYTGPGDSVFETKTENVISNANSITYGRRLSVDKFIIYSYNKEFSNWYGRSDLRGAYRSWWSKEILIRFMNIYMERFGMPTHVAKVPKNMSKPDKELLRTVLDRVQSKYSIVIPDDVAIELLTAGSGGESSFRDSIEMHNKFMSRSILVPDLMGFNTMTGGGSYALGKKHFDVFLWILQKLGRDIEETIIGEQVIKQLVDYNYSNVENYPKFKFESITAEGTATRANIVQMGVSGGFINPEEEWIRDYLAIPKRDEKFALGLPQQMPGKEGLAAAGDTGKQQVDKGGDLIDEGGPTDGEDKLLSDLKNEAGLTDEDLEEQSKKFTLHPKYYRAIELWKKKKFAEEQVEGPDGKKGVWRTVRGRAIFIPEGESPDFGGKDEQEHRFAEHEVEDIFGRKRKITTWPKNWGLEKGKFTAFRSGELKSNRGLVFFAPDKESASEYANIGDIIRKVNKYEVPIEVVNYNKFQKINDLPLDSRFDYKIDFVQMKEDLNEFESETVEALSAIIKEQKDALLKSIEKKGIIENKDYTAVDNLQLKFVGDFKKEIEHRLIKLYLDSKLEMIRELAKGSDGQIQVVTKFADVTIQNWVPVSPTEAIDFFNRKVLAKIITKEGIKKLITMATRKELEYYDSKAFAIAGVEKENILKKAKFILLDGLKVGASTKDVMFNLGNMFDDYLVTGELVNEELTTSARLGTIVRTNFSEALNAGRKAMFDNPDLEDFVPYLRYVAILDDRVRPTHAVMHGKIFKRDNPDIDNFPPSGYSCRCLFVPVTKFEVAELIKSGEGIEISTKDDFPEGFPDKGFNTYTKSLSDILIVQTDNE